jgi:hypothetical protein
MIFIKSPTSFELWWQAAPAFMEGFSAGVVYIISRINEEALGNS